MKFNSNFVFYTKRTLSISIQMYFNYLPSNIIGTSGRCATHLFFSFSFPNKQVCILWYLCTLVEARSHLTITVRRSSYYYLVF